MFTVEPFFDKWVIHNTNDESFVFGPFDTEGDAEFIAQMFRMNKIIFNKGDNHGEASIEESHTVHEHA